MPTMALDSAEVLTDVKIFKYAAPCGCLEVHYVYTDSTDVTKGFCNLHK